MSVLPGIIFHQHGNAQLLSEVRKSIARVKESAFDNFGSGVNSSGVVAVNGTGLSVGREVCVGKGVASEAGLIADGESGVNITPCFVLPQAFRSIANKQQRVKILCFMIRLPIFHVCCIFLS